MKSRKLVFAIAASALVVGVVVLLKLHLTSSSSGDSGKSNVVTVMVSKVERRFVTRQLSVTGALEGIHETDIISEASGKIVKINAEIDNYIPADSCIAVIENEIQEISVEAAQANSDKANADVKRVKSLFSQNAVSETQMENAVVASKAALAQLKLANKNYDNTFLRTPIHGRLAQKFVVIGQMISPGSKIATIVDDSRMKLKVGIPENQLFMVHQGSDVLVTTDAVPGGRFNGKVKTIALKADPQTRTFQGEIELPNDVKRLLRSGMFASAEITTQNNESSPVIPAAGLVEGIGGGSSVFVVRDAVSHLKSVTVGERNDSTVEILGGLELGDLVVTFGQQNLQEGTKVKYIEAN